MNNAFSSAEQHVGLATNGAILPIDQRKSLIGLLLATALTPFAPLAQAQSADSANASTATIYVTANRRREPAREVPIQVGVLKADELQRVGAGKLTDYLSMEPGIDITGQNDKGQGTVTMRGITTGFDFSPTVGVYVDDVPIAASSGYGAATTFDMGLLDLDHIEVYRGPQGTLYGTGAMGGLLKYVTRQPDTAEFSGKVDAMLSSTRHGGLNTSLNAVLNMPIKTDTAAVRASVFRNDNKGFIDSTGPLVQNHVDKNSASGGRLSFLFTPSKPLTIRLTGTIQEINHDGSDWIDIGKNGQPMVGDLKRSQNLAEPSRQKTDLLSADVEYDMGWARINSVTSYQSIHNTNTLDFSIYDGLLQGVFGIKAVATGLANQRSTTKYGQEFRLTSAASKQFEWLAGIYVTKETSATHQDLGTLLAGGVVGPSPLVAQLDTTYKEYALYGTMTYFATPQLALVAGGRISPNRQTYSQLGSGILASKDGPASSSSENSNTYMLTARYALDPNSNIYLRTATGYRAGGINPNSINPVTGLSVSKSPTFTSDTLQEFELGYKAQFLNKRISMETALYNIRWKDIQLTDIVNGFFTYVNGGQARVNGLDFSVSGRATDSLTFAAKLSLIDNKLTSDAPQIGGKSGDRTPNTAKAAAAVSATYAFPLAGHAAYVGLTERYVGQRESSFPGTLSSPNYSIPSYALTDLNAGCDMQKVKLSFFLRNVFDKRGQLAAFTSFIPLGGNTFITPVQPRTLGVTAGITF